MRKFIQNILVAMIVFIGTWILAEFIMGKANIVNDYSYKYNYAMNNPAIKTLLIGHSHFDNSINPYLMGDSVFDFAISGRRWIYWDAKLAEHLFPTMPNLKIVIFPFGYAMPYESAHYEKEWSEGRKEYMYMYTKYMNIPYDRFPQNLIYSSALLSNKMGIKYWKDNHVDSLGFNKMEGKSPYFDEWVIETKIQWDSDTAIMCYNEYKEYFIDLAKVCYNNNIRLVAVTCPCADCYVKATCKRGIQNLYALIDSVRAYYPIEYYNYLNDPEFREDSLYYNCSHLNSEGADKFAIRLKRDLGL